MSFFIFTINFWHASSFWTSSVAFTVTVIKAATNTEAALATSAADRDELDKVQDESEKSRH